MREIKEEIGIHVRLTKSIQKTMFTVQSMYQTLRVSNLTIVTRGHNRDRNTVEQTSIIWTHIGTHK